MNESSVHEIRTAIDVTIGKKRFAWIASLLVATTVVAAFFVWINPKIKANTLRQTLLAEHIGAVLDPNTGNVLCESNQRFNLDEPLVKFQMCGRSATLKGEPQDGDGLFKCDGQAGHFASSNASAPRKVPMHRHL